jgi:NAD dependent epimerase/dehydratase family enzyme
MKTDPEVLLTGCYAVPRRLAEEGCMMQFNELEGALDDLILR